MIEGILNHGGEGVVLRKPHSLYESGRSSELLKIKVLTITLLVCC